MTDSRSQSETAFEKWWVANASRIFGPGYESPTLDAIKRAYAECYAAGQRTGEARLAEVEQAAMSLAATWRDREPVQTITHAFQELEAALGRSGWVTGPSIQHPSGGRDA